MPAIVHFSPALSSGSLVVGKTTVNTQSTGLVDVSVDYLCRSTDLPNLVAKFYIDAPPPVFPSKTIARSALAQGRLHMVNYGVSDEYGIATINARYAGVTSQPVKPFKTFDYFEFGVGARVYVSLTGFYGGQGEVIAFNEPYNDFARLYYAATVGMRGRLESIKYTYATLDTSAALPETMPPQPLPQDVIAELELIPGAFSTSDYVGQFGEVFGSNTITVVQNMETFTLNYEPDKVSGYTVMEYARTQNDIRQFTDLTLEQWRERGVMPDVFINVARQTQAVTPSVYIREIEYRPFTR